MDTRRDHLDAFAVTMIVVCCALWALTQVVVKATLPQMPPMTQGALRSVIAAICVWLFARQRRIVLLSREDTWPGIWAGVLFGMEFCLIYGGLQFTNASRVVVFLYLAPFVVALGMPFIARTERMTLVQSLGLAGAFASLAFAFHEGLSSSSQVQWIGDAMAIAAAIAWGSTTLLIRATSLSNATPERTLFYQLLVSAPVMAAVAWATGERPTFDFSLLVTGSLFFQAVIVAFASYLGWFWLLRHYPATRLSAFTFLTPMFGLVFGAVLLGEPITARLAIAMAGIAVGIWLVNRR